MNVCSWDYNCYSYAVEHREEWLYSIKGVEELEVDCWANWYYLKNGGKINDLIDIFVKKDVLERFPEFTIVKLEDIKEHTRLIAVKLAEDDFHFMKRHVGGHWYHKRGGGEIQRISKEKVFADSWYQSYISKTVFLGYKEDYS